MLAGMSVFCVRAGAFATLFVYISWLKARTVTKAIYPEFLSYYMPCLSPVVAHHFGKHCVAPIAPVKWRKPEAMLLRFSVRESSG